MSFNQDNPLGTVAGSLQRIVTRNEDSGWAVMEIDTDQGCITMVGLMGFVHEGLQIQAEGTWHNHPKFGRQFKVSAARVFEPVGTAGIERFLRSGAVKGVGPVFAKKIVERFGTETLKVLQDESWRLKYLKGVGPKRIAGVVQGMREYRERMEVMSFLHGQLGPVRAQRVFEKYGLGARERIAANPYQLINDFDGIGFLLADKVARDVGVGLEAVQRLVSAVTAVLQEAAGQGHTCVPVKTVIDRLSGLLGDDALAARAVGLKSQDAGWQEIEQDGDGYLELDRHRACDERIAEGLVKLTETPSRVVSIDASKAIPWAAQMIGIEFEAGQVAAIKVALDHKVAIITGGPGVGKSTLLDAILRILEAKGVRVALAAPTGRAARRMRETTGREANTIHRLLEYNPQAGGFMRKKDNTLETDVVVIDESSMMDASLMRALVEGCPQDAKLVLVGDADQLPSVGPGNVLGDVIDSGLVEVARLTKPYRQAANSPIISNAHSINAGVVPDLDSSMTGFEFIETKNKDDTAATILNLMCEELPGSGVDPVGEVMCLLPMNKGTVGIEQMNKALQARLNPNARDELARGDRLYRVGDRVIQMKNNRELEIFNGDVGLIENIDHAQKIMHVKFDGGSIRYPFGELSSLGLAYALTVHRAQGSEYPYIVAAVDMSNSIMLTRKLLYTAVTRAKERVILVGQKRAVHIAVSEARAYRRHTLLTERIKEAARDRRTGSLRSIAVA